jgi:hypothetical protein
VLIYLIGRRLFSREWLAIVCASLLRLDAEPFHPLPAGNGLRLSGAVRPGLAARPDHLSPDGGDKRLFLGTLALGVGLVRYIAAVWSCRSTCCLTLLALAMGQAPAPRLCDRDSAASRCPQSCTCRG